MSYLSQMFGPVEPPPQHVNHKGYVLCSGCSKGVHSEHTTPCECDIEETS